MAGRGGGLGLLALGGLHLLLVYAGLLARTERGWSRWAGRRSFTAALVLLLGAAVMQVVAHRGLAGRPDTAPAVAAAPPAGEVPAAADGAAEPAMGDAAAPVSAEAGEAAFAEALAAVARGGG